ncbi:tumor necrosis factor receptor superfamily member 12A [Discoglossus pictus]
MMLRDMLRTLLLVLLAHMSRGEPETGSSCPSGRSWSEDLGKCMDCSICETSSKSDFCQTCDDTVKQPDFPWLIVGGLSALGVTVITVLLIVIVYLTRCRRKAKFTTPIEETGAHSAEELLIH